MQRILAKGKNIHSTTEPWLLLPLFYLVKENKCYSEFSCTSASAAINDFIKTLDGNERQFNELIRQFALSAYEAASPVSTDYFIDKTPRYALIADEIINTFPDGKFIFLWRNPLSIISSIIETWGNGRWNLYKYHIDIFSGWDNLIHASKKYENRILNIYYEDLIKDPDRVLVEISTYLNVEIGTEVLENFKNFSLEGRFGDKIGVAKYSTVSNEPLSKWKKTINNFFRKTWAKKYLKWLNNNNLLPQKYSYDGLLIEIQQIKSNTKYIFSDILRHYYGFFANYFNFYIISKHFLSKSKLPPFRKS